MSPVTVVGPLPSRPWKAALHDSGRPCLVGPDNVVRVQTDEGFLVFAEQVACVARVVAARLEETARGEATACAE